MDIDIDLGKWKSQIMRGTLEYCVLSLLKSQTRYGYEILQELGKYSTLSSSESSIYPLLRRLQKEGYLEAVWKEAVEGLPPRKYYSITSKGEHYLVAMDKEWQKMHKAITNLKGEQ